MATGSASISAAHDGNDLVRSLIRQLQVDGLAIGDKLPSIRQFAERFQVSASAVRDALVQVQAMGLVRILPRSGAYVQSLDYPSLTSGGFNDSLEGAIRQLSENQFHLIEARRVIELESAAQAAERRRLEDLLPLRELLEQMNELAATKTRSEFVEADVRFHLEIAQIGGNPVLVNMLRVLLGALREHLENLPWAPERREATRDSHGVIYEALVEGDADRAREAMRAHLQMAYDTLLSRVRTVPTAIPSHSNP